MQSTPLHFAVRGENNFCLVEQRLKNGENVNACDEEGWNVLEVAVMCDQPRDIIQLLLDHGADITGSKGCHGSALVHAVGGNLDIMRLLLDHAVTQNDYSPRLASKALAGAANQGDLQMVQFLLAHGVLPSPDGCILQNAAGAGKNSEELVQALLEAGADVNAQGGYHGNALQVAAAYGKTRIVQVLLEAGADINAHGGIYANALTAATERNNIEVVNILTNWHKNNSK